MPDELVHEKYGQIYFVGSGTHKFAYVNAWSDKQEKMIEAFLCVKCGDPIIDEPDDEIFEGLTDANAHRECLRKQRKS